MRVNYKGQQEQQGFYTFNENNYLYIRSKKAVVAVVTYISYGDLHVK